MEQSSISNNNDLKKYISFKMTQNKKHVWVSATAPEEQFQSFNKEAVEHIHLIIPNRSGFDKIISNQPCHSRGRGNPVVTNKFSFDNS